MPCRDYYDEDRTPELEKKIHEQEIALCEARTVIFKLYKEMDKKLPITASLKKKVIQELLLHHTHRQEDKNAQVKKLTEIIKNIEQTEKRQIQRIDDMKILKEQKEDAIKKLIYINSLSDDEIMDRDKF